MGFLPMIFRGMWGTPFGPARPCDYVNVVGAPLPLPTAAANNAAAASASSASSADNNGEPTVEQVKAYHAQYMEALTALYERHKAAYGMADIVLKIV
jgi:hypothetical protein